MMMINLTIKVIVFWAKISGIYSIIFILSLYIYILQGHIQIIANNGKGSTNLQFKIIVYVYT